MIEILISIGFGLLSFLGIFFLGWKGGNKSEFSDAMERVNDDTYAAKKARELLDSNPDHAKRLRDKYTRPD